MSQRTTKTLIATAVLLAGQLTATAFDPFPAKGVGIDDFKVPLPGADVAAAEGDEGAIVTATLAADEANPAEAVLSVEVSLPRGFYIPSTAETNPKPTRFKLTSIEGLEPIDAEWKADRAPKSVTEPAPNGKGLATIEKFFGKVTWSRRYAMTADAASAKVGIDAQYCSSDEGGVCRLLMESYVVSLGVADTETFPFEYEERPVRLGPYPGIARIKLAPKDAKKGDEVAVTVTIDLDKKWHVYSTTMAKQIGGEATTIDLTLHGLEAVDKAFKADRKPVVHDNEFDEGKQLEYFENSVTWTRKFKVTEAPFGVRGKLRFQTCADACKPAATVDFALGTVEAVAEKTAAAGTADQVGDDDELVSAKTEDLRDAGLLPFLLAAVLAGFFALLTPCVFPMVPITVSFFLKQSEKEHSKPVALASVYALGIIITFTLLGLLMAAIFGATGLNQLASNPWLNLAIAGVLVFFGANLLGLFEIRMPSALVNWSSGKQGQGGYIGALFMAFTFTLMSFTCTFAFAGGLLVWAANGEYFWPILGMLAFSAAFSLPFFFLALFPSYLQKLPKSGGWMNTVKVTMGMIELGAAFKFLNSFAPLIFDYSIVMCAWFVISVCTGLYLLGAFRLGHDTPTESISVIRLGFAMGFLGLAAFLANGLYGTDEPEGVVWEQLASFAPPRVSGGQGELGPYREDGGLKYALDVDQAIEYAKAEGKPLFFDFTGYQCTNCRLMEKRAHRPANKKLLEGFVLVQLYLDQWPPEIPMDPAEAERIVERNRELAVDWLKDVTMPSYVIVKPDGERVESVQPFIGLEKENGEFTRFLKQGVTAWERIDDGRQRTRIARR